MTCSVWRFFLCFQIMMVYPQYLSQTLPLPCLSLRMPCLTVPVGNTYTTFYTKVLCTNCLIQFIKVVFCLATSSISVLYGIVVEGIILVKHRKVIGPRSRGRAAPPHYLCCSMLEVGLHHRTISAAVCWRWGCSTTCKAIVLQHTVLVTI